MAAPSGKRALFLPVWVEAIVVIAMIAMAVVEFTHGQWIWAGIFGITGSLFGASLASRLLMGDDDGRE